MNLLASSRKFFHEAPWQLWTAQLTSLIQSEVKRNFLKRRSLWIYLVAFAPTAILLMLVLKSSPDDGGNIQDRTNLMAWLFQIYYLHVGIFIGCLGIFTWLFRGEIVEKTLHYHFLSPMRRELLVLGKFLAGIITTALIFALGVFSSFFLIYAHGGSAGRAFVLNGPGLGHLMAYLGVTVLACLGYGSMFVAFSLVIKNPIVPAIFVLVWETFHAVLPSLLQKFSIMFYLKQLSPVPVPSDGIMALFAVTSEPVPPWLAVPGLLCLCAGILVFACLRIHKMEISYLAD
ncbi:MAG TPA: ABC transporter permease [Candidatus Angelobacter sp.]|jgi:ABC-type transport system involved in multi-copper enzyme maturation permease subunit|nr:ABC transporter permease [Candidatus Angelobacter sp.]